MGKVRMTESHRVQGVYEPVESIVDYTYCDECGSFNIGYLFPIYKRVLVAVEGCIIVVVLIALYAHNWAVCAVAGLMGGLIVLVLRAGPLLQCRKCGNKHVTDANVLRYPNSYMNIDVPDDCIIKHFVSTVIYS